MVEPGKPCPSDGAVALRHGGERSIELRAKSNRLVGAAKLNHLAAHGVRSEKLCALQWLGPVRQRRKPTIQTALPIFGPWQRVAREAAQIAQAQRQQPARQQCRRQRGQQSKRERCYSAACEDC